MASRPSMTTTVSPARAGALALLSALALAAPAAAPASAAAPPAPKPAAFALSASGSAAALRLRGTAGRVLRGAVRVRNVSRRPITVRLQPADIRNASNGNADYVTTRLSGAGRWLRLATTNVRLAPHAIRRVAFTVRIPASSRGASHYAGIVAIDAADIAAAARRRTASAKTFSFSRIVRQALPLTIRLPGPLTRSLALRSVKIAVEPAGAGLVLGLRPGGSVLIASARVRLRVLRDSRTVLSHASTLGQLFPRAGLNFRVPWVGRPTKGSYRVVGVIRPKRAAAVRIDQMIEFTPAEATQLARKTPPAAALPGMPLWVWVVLGAGGALLHTLSVTVWKLRRRPAEQVA
jgi:hypothetical protein